MTAAEHIYLQGRILSVDPLVTISAVAPAAPLGLASLATELFGDRPAIHLLHHSWSLEIPGQDWIARAIESASTTMPNAQFLMLASNDLEAIRFEANSMVASALIFLDERVWRPVPAAPHSETYDAVYVGRLDPMKRHELAAGIEKILLVYGHTLEGDHQQAVARVRDLLPRAHFANEEGAGGKYRLLSHERIAGLLGQASVGLCLSAVEGCMRASMEYMLSGLPVVSTKSIGGRDRYFGTSYCRIVEDDPDAIARAVAELSAMKLDRWRIREHVAQTLSFERYNFLLTLNRLMADKFGAPDQFPSFTPFLGALAVFRRSDELVAEAKQAFLQAV
jgi:glycosyltransferase involved in cell wall biosynthesis